MALLHVARSALRQLGRHPPLGRVEACRHVAPLARAFAPLSTRPGKQLSVAEENFAKEEEESLNAMWEKLNAGKPEPRFRDPVPVPPTTHVETWAPVNLVSSNVDENALEFRSRFYIDAKGTQPAHANKVQLAVKLSRLGLNPLERKRLLAVAYPYYNAKRGELRLSCNRYAEAARNKQELRDKVTALLADARENAEAHAATPDSELPLAARSRPWRPRDPRAYYGSPKRKLNKGSPG